MIVLTITAHDIQTLLFLYQVGCQWRMQLLIQPWICTPGTKDSWVDRGSVDYNLVQSLPDTSTHDHAALQIEPKTC